VNSRIGKSGQIEVNGQKEDSETVNMVMVWNEYEMHESA